MPAFNIVVLIRGNSSSLRLLPRPLPYFHQARLSHPLQAQSLWVSQTHEVCFTVRTGSCKRGVLYRCACVRFALVKAVCSATAKILFRASMLVSHAECVGLPQVLHKQWIDQGHGLDSHSSLFELTIPRTGQNGRWNLQEAPREWCE